MDGKGASGGVLEVFADIEWQENYSDIQWLVYNCLQQFTTVKSMEILVYILPVEYSSFWSSNQDQKSTAAGLSQICDFIHEAQFNLRALAYDWTSDDCPWQLS